MTESGGTQGKGGLGWPQVMIIAEGVGQIGCLTLVIILAALALGLWLDNRLDTRPWFTLGLVLASIPLSLVALVRAALGTARRAQPAQPKENADKDSL